MYITFLIGNGFDIGLGLKTRYGDFSSPYFFSRIKPCLIAMAVHIARQRRAKKKHGVTRLFAY